MKATTLMLLLTLALGAGCRTKRLGSDPVIPKAFAAQAAKQGGEPAKLDATDAQLIMVRHHEPMVPPQQAQAGVQPMVLPAPQLGTP